MKKSDAKTRIEFLRREIDRHNDLYYRHHKPEISDFQYDILLNELETLEKRYPELASPDSPTRKPGSDILKEFVQYRHEYPMLSLANTYTEGELTDFDVRVRKSAGRNVKYVCELKLDGASVSIRYENGRFKRALSRGDGEAGDDVSANIGTIKSIPKQLDIQGLPDVFTIRGEVIFHRDDFRRLNETRTASGEQPFANPRNAASGTLKTLDSRIVAGRPLDCYLYYLLGENLPSDSHYENMKHASSWGFKVSDAMRLCNSIEEVLEFIHEWDERRREIDFEIDGVVVKTDSISIQKQLGFTSKTPRWAVAFKYKADQERTKLLSVSFQVGRTGTVTPVANLEPVLLAGTTVRRASLHNADQVKLLDLHLGDAVYIEKGGEIIPKIVGVDISARGPVAVPVQFPESCPECGTRLTRNEGEANWYCPNDMECPPQIKGRIEHFISRKAMNIEGIGEETVDLLFSRELVRDVSDLYDLTESDIAVLEGLGEKSASNIIASIRKSAEVPFHRVLFALGIRHVGESTARSLANYFGNIEALIAASPGELVLVPDIGQKVAGSISGYFGSPGNLKIIEKLRRHGIKMETGGSGAGMGVRLAGMSVVITGTFALHSRDDYKEMIIRNGGKSLSSVTKGTTFVLAGENAGPAKLEAARKLGIPVRNEQDFLEILK